MAFGKNEEDLKGVSGFNGAPDANAMRRQRQRLAQAHDEQRSRGGGGSFSDLWKPPTEEYALIRLIPGTFETKIGHRSGGIDTLTLEYFPFTEHFHGIFKRGTVCSGGPFHYIKNKREPCLGCDKYWTERPQGVDDKGKKKKGPVSKREMYAFSLLHLTTHHKVVSMDKHTGRPRVNEETKEPYYEWVPCIGRLCPMCKDPNIESTPAKARHWPMGTVNFDLLTGEFANQIGAGCGSCCAHDSIRALAWTCKACGEAVIDMEETTLKDDQIREISANEAVCPHCQRKGYLQEVLRCEECKNGRRATIFDVDMNVKRAETGQDDRTVLIMKDFKIKPIDEHLKQYVVSFPLDRINAPTPMDVQIQLLGGESGGGPRAGARPYSGR